uniref:Uncharacterized protein n=1 Tax=Setaria viridis TaxID=4556 RepID=A0A4V6DAU9_SETVI|nr:hypothetical protein SEVIR_2G109701v2 [Setaria viridis]
MAGTRDASSQPLHVVVFPWLAFGHMIPFLELSKRLARRGHAVTFVSTPRNAARLAAIPPELSPRLRVATLDLPAVEGLPDGAESTADVTPEKVEFLKTAFDGLAAPFAALVGEGCCASRSSGNGEAAADGFERKPGWIILDFAQNWVLPIAEEQKIACAMFLILPAALLAYVGTKHANEARPRRTTEWRHRHGSRFRRRSRTAATRPRPSPPRSVRTPRASPTWTASGSCTTRPAASSSTAAAPRPSRGCSRS